MTSMALIRDAVHFLKGKIRHTPLEASPVLSAKLGVPVWLKMESLQLMGSFKMRGALFRLSRLSEEEKKKGIVTCSAGNHGKAVAFASNQLSVHVQIYVPKTVDESKYEGMKALGANVIRSDFPGYDETEAFAKAKARELGLPFVSAFDDDAVMAANGGSLAWEVLEDLPDLKNLVVPVGGGGLAAGASVLLRERSPKAKLIPCQLAASPALRLSLERDQAVLKLPYVETLAGGLEGGIGAATFEVIKNHIQPPILVDEQDVLDGFHWLLAGHQYLIEPSAAAVIGACISGKIQGLEGPTAIVLSGRNVSMTTISSILEHYSESSSHV